ncbi:hypothetical protein RchiOBHm_Chr2g0128471 [Rosa chinensis]|uniref:Uncharacterized protein n=1 Tax=Rosa chinensis TaxID=74649 RepID=A0A2P6RUB4_ROSCH|nr:hypothetical protein RchiOBHm_Chr2g0128471 [Rosa chinensis]
MRCDSMRERCVVANASQCTDDVSINCQSSDLIVLDKSDGKRWNELLESSIGGLSAESNGGSNISSVHGTEISQQSDKAKLEETCVMVSGEELHFVHHMVANCKPYKKKFQKPSLQERVQQGNKNMSSLHYGMGIIQKHF